MSHTFEPNSVRAFYLPRLERVFYQADAVVHWQLSTAHRARGWLGESFQQRFRELLLHAAAREGLFCPVYCLMPDHLHLVWMGLRPDSDQLNAMAFLRTHLAPALGLARFQHQPYDHVLRDEERHRDALAGVCRYILENPVMAGLVARAGDWKFSGSIVAGYPALHPAEASFWPLFWRLYHRCKHPEASKVRRPLRGERPD